MSIDVIPSINVLSHQNCVQKLKIHNLSSRPKSVAKGVKIATCSTEYAICESDTISVNLVSDQNPIDIMCSKITDLSPSQLHESRQLLKSYEDIFTVSSKQIGCANVQKFDVDENIPPVTVPLRRIPINHRDIVKQLIEKYEQLHLLEPIESPFRASTVLVKKKNPANSTGVTDMYRLCTDYRLLNNSLTSSGFPSPSLDDCLDAVGNADMFSSVDFKAIGGGPRINSGYFLV